jgi:Zn-dependent protease
MNLERLNINLGSVGGTKIKLHSSMVIFWGVITLLSLGQGLAGIITQFLVLLVIYTSVLVHELAHVTVARKLYKIPCPTIWLSPIGGMAMINANALVNPKVELTVSAAGPLCSLALGFAFWGANALDHNAATGLCCKVNFIIAFFNLIPAFPLDGGRIFRSVLTMVLQAWGPRKTSFGKAYNRSTRITVWVAVGFALIGVVVGLKTTQYEISVISVLVGLVAFAERSRLS